MFEKIELYLAGELTGEELRLFEEQLQQDPLLREQLLIYQSIDADMKAQYAGAEKEKNLNETLTALNKQYFSPVEKPVASIPVHRKKSFFWPAAAAALVLCFAAWWFLLRDQSSKKDLYAQYAVHQPLSFQRGPADTSLSKREAITDYNNKQYTAALNGLQQAVQNDTADTELRLAYSICLLETGKYDEALAGFESIAVRNKVFQNQALWYKALVYLKKEDKASCKKILETIPADADVYNKAQALLKEL